MNIRDVFGPPKPLEIHQVAALQALQEAFFTLAAEIVKVCPRTEHREEALQALERAYIDAQVAAREPKSIVTPATLADLLPLVERRNTIVARIWMNVNDFPGIRKFGRDVFDQETHREMLMRGIMGHIWMSQVRIGSQIPEGFVVLEGEDEIDPEAPDPGRDWEPPPDKLVRI
jgi:hypothetical protein